MVSETDSKHWGRILFIGVAIMVVAGQYYFWNNTTDDAFILFRYAARFISGHGLTFNPGEHVEGYSSPLWLLMVSGCAAIFPFPIPIVARCLGILCEIGVLYFSWRIIGSIMAENRMSAATLFFATILLTPGFHYFAGAGLETMLLAFLLVFGVWNASRNNDIIASISFGLAGITRPEGVLYIAAWLIWKWIYRRERLATAVIFSIFFPFAWEIFRLSYYHAWLPNTGIAKFWHGFGDLGFSQMARFAFPPVIVIVLSLFLRKGKFPIGFLKPILTFCCGLTAAGIVFVVYAGGDWMFFGRFVIPLFPIAILLFAVWTATAIRSKKQYSLVIVTFILAQCIAWSGPMQRYIDNEGFAMLMRSDDPLRAAEWVHAHYPSGTTLATARLGAISYINSNFIVWDFAGLTDREEALFRKDPDSKQDPILARNPMLISETNVPADWNYRNDTGYYRWLSEHYTLVYSVPQGNFGSLDLWQKQ